jgi:2-dehydro-3-deoxyphosphooctonate aldolase (KDO 8-P synthase)
MGMATQSPQGIYNRFGTNKHPKPIVLLAGPCVAESEKLCMLIVEHLLELRAKYRIPVVFKASFDKANRTSLKSFRGPGLHKGLKMLARVKKRSGLPSLTDIHAPEQAGPVSEIADIIQIPAFLCRQTDLLVAAARTGVPVNIKKGQFMAPDDMLHSMEKVRGSGNRRVMLTERGTCFGYNNLVADMRALPIMRAWNVPVIFDATHAVQRPAAQRSCSSGEPQFIAPLARAAVAAGVDGLFLEVHPEPPKALSDAGCMLALRHLEPLLKEVLALDAVAKKLKPSPAA